MDFQRMVPCLLHGTAPGKKMRSNLEQAIQKEGLLVLGVVDLDVSRDYERFLHWLRGSLPQNLQYLKDPLGIRENPARVLPGSTCSIVVALSYPNAEIKKPAPARYARGRDYHTLFRKRIERALQPWKDQYLFRICTDSIPILERALAAKTPAGFIGRNTMYIHSQYGSYLLLAEILTNAPLEIDSLSAKPRGCGGCRECQIFCPTGALDKDYKLDPNRCLSYWTIEHRGPIPLEFWPYLAEYYFGCDLCQEVCPYNRKPVLDSTFETRPIPPLEEIASMDTVFYQKHFWGTPMARATQVGLQRNAIIAMAAIAHPKLEEIVKNLKKNPLHPVLSKTLEQLEEFTASSRDLGPSQDFGHTRGSFLPAPTIRDNLSP